MILAHCLSCRRLTAGYLNLQSRNSEIERKTAISRKIKNFVKKYCFKQEIIVYYDCRAMGLDIKKAGHYEKAKQNLLTAKRTGH